MECVLKNNFRERTCYGVSPYNKICHNHYVLGSAYVDYSYNILLDNMIVINNYGDLLIRDGIRKNILHPISMFGEDYVEFCEDENEIEDEELDEMQYYQSIIPAEEIEHIIGEDRIFLFHNSQYNLY